MVTPDLPWYKAISERKGVPPRCPYASVDRCPRYYQSLSLLGSAGSTAIPRREDERLLRKWGRSDIWPKTGEQATSIFGPEGDPHIFSNFCPEVSFDRFGYFAAFLAQYPDETDAGAAHVYLRKQEIPFSDPRWTWAGVHSMHFTDCPYYSLLPVEPPTRYSSLKMRVQEHPLGVTVLALSAVGAVVLSLTVDLLSVVEHIRAFFETSAQ